MKFYTVGAAALAFAAAFGWQHYQMADHAEVAVTAASETRWTYNGDTQHVFDTSVIPNVQVNTASNMPLGFSDRWEWHHLGDLDDDEATISIGLTRNGMEGYRTSVRSMLFGLTMLKDGRIETADDRAELVAVDRSFQTQTFLYQSRASVKACIGFVSDKEKGFHLRGFACSARGRVPDPEALQCFLNSWRQRSEAAQSSAVVCEKRRFDRPASTISDEKA